MLRESFLSLFSFIVHCEQIETHDQAFFFFFYKVRSLSEASLNSLYHLSPDCSLIHYIIFVLIAYVDFASSQS